MTLICRVNQCVYVPAENMHGVVTSAATIGRAAPIGLYNVRLDDGRLVVCTDASLIPVIEPARLRVVGGLDTLPCEVEG